jgi:hypothetical protein
MAEKSKATKSEKETVEIEALYVQLAKRMGYENGELTLYDVAPTTLLFSDRPDRYTAHIPSLKFVQEWGLGGKDSFASDPPNAALSIFSGEEAKDVVVELRDPVMTGDHITYNVEILDGEMPASGGPSSLFIDVIGRPLSPMSVAGVRRRSRRR